MKKKKNRLLIIFTIIIMLLFFAFIMRGLTVFSKDTVWRNDNFCKLRYNTTERGAEEIFGKYCAIPDFTTHTLIKYYYNDSEMYNYCETNIRFFELNKWMDKCS